MQAFLERQVAERELPNDVIAAGRLEMRGKKFSDRPWRAGDALPALHEQIEGRRARLLGLLL